MGTVRHYVGKLLVMGVFVLFACIRGNEAIVVNAGTVALSQESYEERFADAIRLAEVFRLDEDFIHNTNLTVEQESQVRELLENTVLASGDSGEEEYSDTDKVQQMAGYVRRKLTTGTEAYGNTYDMLCADDYVYTTGSQGYALAMRDLCILEGIPCFRLMDERSVTESYAILMIYIDDAWYFLDVADEEAGLVGAEDVFAQFFERMLPTMMAFDYNRLNGIIYGIYISESAWNDGCSERGIYETVFFDQDRKEAVMMKNHNILRNGHYYGTNAVSDEEGRAPTGLVEFVEKNGADTWDVWTGYVQYGIPLSGRAVIDGTEYDFSNEGTIYRVPYYQKSKRAMTESEREEYFGIRSRIKEQAVQVAEALSKDDTYVYDMYFLEEEKAYLQEIMELCISREWMLEQEDVFAAAAVEIPAEGEEASDKAKAMGILAYIDSHISYIGGMVSQNSYDTLQKGKGTCSNYMTVFRDLCVLADIPCFSLGGAYTQMHLYSVLSDHASNLVKLDGEWYYVDPQRPKIYKPIDFNDFVPFSFVYGQEGNTQQVAVSYEAFMYQITNPYGALCYEFEEDGTLAIYQKKRSGCYENYECMEYTTDANGKLSRLNGFIYWEEEEETSNGKIVKQYEGYVRQGYTVMGPNWIAGKLYEFERVPYALSNFTVGHCIDSHTLYRLGTMNIETIADYEYTGEQVCPTPVIKNGDKVLTPGVDYEITSYQDNLNVTPEYSYGAAIIMEGRGDYYGSVKRYYKILKKDISDMEVTLSQTEYTLNAEGYKYGFCPEVTIDIPETDYYVTYSDTKTPGEATVKITGKNNCTGVIERKYTIYPADIGNGDFAVVYRNGDPIGTYTYTGEGVKPEIDLYWYYEDGSVFGITEAYTVSYQNNVECGTATMILEGNGVLTGRLESDFTIIPQVYDIADIRLSYDRVKYNGAIQHPVVLAMGLQENEQYEIKYQKKISEEVWEEVTPVEVGEYYVCIVMKDSNYQLSNGEEIYRMKYSIVEADGTGSGNGSTGSGTGGTEGGNEGNGSGSGSTGSGTEGTEGGSESGSTGSGGTGSTEGGSGNESTGSGGTGSAEGGSGNGSTGSGGTGSIEGESGSGANGSGGTGSIEGESGSGANGSGTGSTENGVGSGSNGSTEGGNGSEATGSTENGVGSGSIGNGYGNTGSQSSQNIKKGSIYKDTGKGYVYVVLSTDANGGTVAFKSAGKNAKKVVIPKQITIEGKTYKVIAIADKAFYKCGNLVSVTIGKNVTSIGKKAFYKCTKLTKVTIPGNVSKIGKQAFAACKKLKTITIKTKKLSAKNLGSKIFSGIHKKAKFKLPKGKQKLYKRIMKL